MPMLSAGALARMDRAERRELLGRLAAVYVPDTDHGDGGGFTTVRIDPDVLADLSAMHWRGGFVALQLGTKAPATFVDFIYHARAFNMVIGDASAHPKLSPWWWPEATRALYSVGVFVGREANRRDDVQDDACTIIAATPDAWKRGDEDSAKFWTPADAIREGYLPLLIDREAREVRRLDR